MAGGYVEYHEPGVLQLLVLSSFFYLLNVARWLADWLLYAGLIGEIAVGIIYGPALADILDTSWEQTFLVVGYIGLILIVFEGGLDFNTSIFISNVFLSLIVAATGILLPIAFSFALLGPQGFGYSNVEAFASGSALSSTSLGTTFFVLSAAAKGDVPLELSKTQVGTVLIAAALIDDVIGLVMLSIIPSLGSNVHGDMSLGWTIGRPVLAAVLMAALVPPIFYYATHASRRVFPDLMIFKSNRVVLFVSITLLSGYIAAAFYAGTSVLLGAFLAGLCLSLLPDFPAAAVFRAYIKPVQEHLLEPLFFASIGYSIPFLDLWTGKRIWHGIVYSILMIIAKLAAGVCILIWDMYTPSRSNPPEVGIMHALRPSMPDRESVSAAALLGFALVARGEIGVLIATVATSPPSEVLGNDAYINAIWAILMCTIIGPLAVGWIVRREGERIVDGRWGQSPQRSE